MFQLLYGEKCYKTMLELVAVMRLRKKLLNNAQYTLSCTSPPLVINAAFMVDFTEDVEKEKGGTVILFLYLIPLNINNLLKTRVLCCRGNSLEKMLSLAGDLLQPYPKDVTRSFLTT
jgi:hypothetical protein